MWIPDGYRIVKTRQRVGTQPVFVTRFRKRADKKAYKLNESRIALSYRYEVLYRWADRKYAVWAMQNRLEKDV